MILIVPKLMSLSLIVAKRKKIVFDIGVAVVGCDDRRAAFWFVISIRVLFDTSPNSVSIAVVRSKRPLQLRWLDLPVSLQLRPTSACYSVTVGKFSSTWTQIRDTLIFHY